MVTIHHQLAEVSVEGLWPFNSWTVVLDVVLTYLLDQNVDLVKNSLKMFGMQTSYIRVPCQCDTCHKRPVVKLPQVPCALTSMSCYRILNLCIVDLAALIKTLWRCYPDITGLCLTLLMPLLFGRQSHIRRTELHSV